MPSEAQDVSLYPQIHSTKTQITRCENKSFFCHYSQNKDETMQWKIIIINFDGFYFISQDPSFRLYYWESNTLILLTQIKSVNLEWSI